MNALPVFLGIFASIGILAFLCKEAFDAVDRYLGSQRTWLENKKISIENMLKKDVILLPEGNVALVHPELEYYDRIPVPRAPRIQKIIDVSEDQERPLLQEPIPEQFSLDGVTAIHDQERLYFGRASSKDILVPLDDAYHILDIASSGKGKSNRFRLLMMQAVKKGCRTYFISPAANDVKALKKTDSRKIEVWQPLFQRLEEQPKKSGEEIQDLLSRLVKEIGVRHQREHQHDTTWEDEPIYVFIDEMPEVVSRCPTAPECIDTIGRLGRQYKIFACVATQDGLVQTIKQSTGAQANYKTRIYGGGDKISATRIMKSKVNDDKEIALQSNGAGLTLMLAEGLVAPTFVRAPLVTNEALFSYLDAGPFVLEEWLQERPYEIQLQPHLSQEQFQTSSVEVERPSRHALSFTGFTSDSTEQVEPVETPLKVSDQKQRALTEDEKFAVFNAINQIEQEGRRLTLNAIKTRTGLSWTVDAALKELCTKLNKPLP